MNLYVPKNGVENLSFILETFISTHEDSEASVDDVKVAQNLLDKLETRS